jgi:hypothetical protein
MYKTFRKEDGCTKVVSNPVSMERCMHSVLRRTALPWPVPFSPRQACAGPRVFFDCIGCGRITGAQEYRQRDRLAGTTGDTGLWRPRSRDRSGDPDQPRPRPLPMARVAGDMADIATVAKGLQQGNPKKENSGLALAALAAVTLLDIACATGLSAEKGGLKTAVTDYSKRSGFPGGLSAAKGATSDFSVPDDMGMPELLRRRTFDRQVSPIS